MTVAAPVLPAHVLYGRLLATAAREALDARVRLDGGGVEPLALQRWLGPVSAADARIADEARGPVLDVGCGPGRMLAALQARGTTAMGVDLSPVAVLFARRRGAHAVTGSIFAEVPGTWATALLLDGNVGIGGDPVALLRRVGALLRPGGTAAVEVDAPGRPTRRERLRIEAAGTVSDWFPWARVGVDGVAAVAGAAGLAVERVEAHERRWFAWLAA